MMMVTHGTDLTMYRGPQFNTQMAKPAHNQKVTMVLVVLMVVMVNLLLLPKVLACLR